MTETWKSMHELGFSRYEASTEGRIRNRTGQVLAARPQNRGYLIVTLTDDTRVKQTKTVHTLILGTFRGPCPAGQESRHLDDDPKNNRLENLEYGTAKENNADKVKNGNRAAAPVRQAKTCVRCEADFMGNGRRCHACVVWIGVTAASMLSSGVTLAVACNELEYPSPEGLHTLAVKYGGYGQRRQGSWLRRVIGALRDWLELGDGQ